MEERQKERMDSEIWLEVQTLKDRMSKLYSVLAERVKDPYTKTSELPIQFWQKGSKIPIQKQVNCQI